jgi:hypothetical protein
MTKTSEDIYFIVAVTGMFFGQAQPKFNIDIDGRDLKSYVFEKKTGQTMEILFPANGLDFSLPHSLNITLTNKHELEDLVNNKGELVQRSGIEIVNIAAVFMPSKRQFSVASTFGLKDNSGRPVQEGPMAPHLMKFGDRIGMKFWINGDILSKECKFYGTETKQVTGKNFKIYENGRYALEFRSPINYWILQRFYVLDK